MPRLKDSQQRLLPQYSSPMRKLTVGRPASNFSRHYEAEGHWGEQRSKGRSVKQSDLGTIVQYCYGLDNFAFASVFSLVTISSVVSWKVGDESRM